MLIVTEAANLRQVLGGNSICQETHTHTQQSRQNPCPLSISQQQIPGVVLQMPPGPWPSLTLLQQSHSHGQCRLSRGHEMCGVEHGPNQDYVLSNMQKLLLFFFFNFREKTEGKDNTGSTQNSERKTPSAFWYWALGHEFFPVAAIQGIFH